MLVLCDQLDYGCIVYESASSMLLKKLDVMQDKALKG